MSDVIKMLEDGTLQISDDGVLSASIRFMSAGVSIKGLSRKNKERLALFARGELVGVRHTKRKIPTVTFKCMVSDLLDASDATVITDIVRGTGAWASAVSTLPGGANAEVTTLRMVLTVEGTAHGDAADHTIELDKVAFDIDSFDEGEPNEVTISGEIYIFEATEDTDVVMT